MIENLENEYIDIFYEKMVQERIYQLNKWSGEFDSNNTPNDWSSFILKYSGNTVTLPWNPQEFKKQLVKVATICAAAYEWCERTKGNMPRRHYDI